MLQHDYNSMEDYFYHNNEHYFKNIILLLCLYNYENFKTSK